MGIRGHRTGRRICRYTAACTSSTTGAETYTYDAAGNMTQAKNAAVTGLVFLSFDRHHVFDHSEESSWRGEGRAGRALDATRS